MEIFLPLFIKIIPLYFTILLGYIAGKYLKIEGHNVSTLMLYIIVPIVIFDSVARMEIDVGIVLLPVIIFVICCLFCYSFLFLGKKLWGDSRANVLALLASEGNTGYFGLPIALILFDNQTVAIYITAYMGIVMFEVTIGFYTIAVGKHSARESIIKLLRLPILYALIFGIIYSLAEIPYPEMFATFGQNARGAFTILGMMIIGFGIASIKKFYIDWTFIGLSFLAKFVLWPVVMLAVIYADKQYFHFYNESVYSSFILISIVPFAASAVIYASALKSHPERVATAVLLGTLFAMIYLPIMVSLLLH